MGNKTKKERGVLVLLIVAVLIMTVGFALYASTLTINGNVTVKGSPWNVHYNSSYGTSGINRTSGSVTPGANSELINASGTDFSFTVTLEKPGDFYEATVQVINEGSMPAILKSITMSSPSAAQQNYLSYTLTYDGTDYTQSASNLSSTLAASGTKLVKVRVEYLQPANQSDLPSSDVTFTATGSLLYESE